MKRKRPPLPVKYYNPEDGSITTMPQADLPPDCVRVRIEGMEKEGIMWMIAPEENDIQHPPFQGERREAVRTIQIVFREVYPKTYEEWEEGFRRDTNPDSEIQLWLRMADFFIRYSEGRDETQRNDVYLVLLACTTQPREFVPQAYRTSIKSLSHRDAEAIVEAWFTEDDTPDPPPWMPT